MLLNYFKIALRSLWRNRFQSVLNVAGLGIGMACCLTIILFVRDELGYDRFHVNAHRIQRLVTGFENAQTGQITEASTFAIGPYRLGDALNEYFPELAASVRITPRGRTLVAHGEQRFYEEGIHAVGAEFFDIFSFPLSRGSPGTALTMPFTVVLSAEASRKYFGDADPLGEVLTFNDGRNGAIDFEVTGVLAERPGNTHFRFDFLASMPDEFLFPALQRENWKALSSYTYVMLPPTLDAADFAARLPAFSARHVPEGMAVFAQALTDIHLRSHLNLELAPNGSIVTVSAFAAIAALVLLIACINFTNLATALAGRRGREVGLRKAVGGQRLQLVQQFLGESTLLAALGLALAVSLVETMLPYFNAMTGKELALDIAGKPYMLVALVIATLGLGLGAGMYPALFLSAFEPARVLRGPPSFGKGGLLRSMLITFQFAAAIALIVCTAVLHEQLDYVGRVETGYDREHLLALTNVPASLRTRYEQFTAQLRSDPRIVAGAAVSQVPPEALVNNIATRPEGFPAGEGPGLYTVWTDFGFIEALDLEMAAGRGFSREFPADANEAFVINEAAARMLGWSNEDAVGKTFGSQELQDGQWTWREGRVIGVLKDFHFESLRQEILPTVYFIAPAMTRSYVIRLLPGDPSGALAHIERTWQDFVPELPLEYHFLDERFAGLYRSERVQGSLLTVFAGLAILVACLGLLGLAAYNTARRTKEIGVRKVMGGSVWSIVLLLTKDFSKLVLLSNVIAWPIAYVAMQRWLENFAYRIDLTPLVFIGSGAIALCIAWVTVGGTAAKAASAKPVLALRYE